ncbi:MAG: hypothetical protein V3T83_09955 [Acidobacteriota bacterium]
MKLPTLGVDVEIEHFDEIAPTLAGAPASMRALALASSTWGQSRSRLHAGMRALPAIALLGRGLLACC